MSATRPTPETDVKFAEVEGISCIAAVGEMSAFARQLERERDQMVGQIAQLRRQITSHEETEDANLDDMRQTMRETADILAQIPAAYDSRFFRAGQWANAALAKLQPFIKP